VVPQADLLPKARALMETIISKAPLAISNCIRSANAVFGSTNGFTIEIDAFGECFETEDMKEGTKAFLEKRKAKFTGK